MKLLLAFAMAIGLAILPVRQAFACSCAEMTIDEAAAMAQAAFTGTVIDEQPVGKATGPIGAVAATAPMPGGMGGQFIYTFEVDGVAKGDVGERASVLGGGDGASCGMSFAVGQRWLLFTMWDGTVHSTSLCSGNVPLGPDEDAPLPVSAPGEVDVSQPPTEIPWTAVALLGAVALVAGVSAFAFRRSEPRVV